MSPEVFGKQMLDPGSDRQNESFKYTNFCFSCQRQSPRPRLRSFVLRTDPASKAFGGLLSAAGGRSGCCISIGWWFITVDFSAPLLKIAPLWKAGESARLFSPGQMTRCPPAPSSLGFYAFASVISFLSSSPLPEPPPFAFLPSFPSEKGSFTFILRTLQRGGISAAPTEDSSSKKTKG